MDTATAGPSRASSPWILRWPHAGFSRANWTISDSTEVPADGRRYLGLDILARSRITLAPGNATEVTPDNDLQALSA